MVGERPKTYDTNENSTITITNNENIKNDVRTSTGVLGPTDSHSRGLFAGLSLEGGVIVSRPDVNRKFYGRQVSVRWVIG